MTLFQQSNNNINKLFNTNKLKQSVFYKKKIVFLIVIDDLHKKVQYYILCHPKMDETLKTLTTQTYYI